MKLLVTLLLYFYCGAAFTQPRYNARLLDSLAFIAHTQTPAKHFATLYYQAIEITNRYADKQPDSVKNFIFGFEALFAPVFSNSYKNYINKTPQVFYWQQYYADTNLNDLQYKFIGMAAHINGDMAVALAGRYGYDTLKKYRRPLIRFQKALNTFFDSIYITSRRYKKLNRLHFITLGLDKAIGKAMVLHWRKKQVRLALLYYTNPPKYAAKRRRLEKKMLRLRKFAIEWIK